MTPVDDGGSPGQPRRAGGPALDPGSAPIPPARRDRLALLALALVALAARLALRIDYDEDIDALRFRLGVERFSVAELRPHAPFYPVYIAAAKIAAALGASPRGALAIVGAAAGAVVVASTALLAREALGRRAAYVAGGLALASPFLWLTSEKLLSDMTGAAFVAAALALAARARRLPDRAAPLRTAALVILGLGLGARLSYFPFAIAAVAVIARAEGGGRAWAARARDLLTGVVLWLVPLVIAGRPRALVAVSLVQAEGHFFRWGGSAITVSSPAARLRGIAWGLWANALGGPWLDTPAWRWIAGPILALLLALALSALARARPLREQPELWAGAIAYFAWAALGQNVAYKPRHLLPLAPLLVVALAAGEGALARHLLPRRAARIGAALAAVLGAVWLADGAALAWAHRSPSPAAAVVASLAASDDRRPVMTRDLGRMIAEGAPGRAVIPAGDDRALAEAAAALPGGVLVTSEWLTPDTRLELAARGLEARLVMARPRSRYVDSLWSELGLWEVRPAEGP